MAIAVTVPRLGWTMDEGTFLEWRKQDGDTVAVGEPLFVLESEKSAEEIPALDAGILRIPADGPQPGDVVKVGQVLAYLAVEGEVVEAKKPEVSSQKSEQIRNLKSEIRSQQTERRSQGGSSSPRARRVARELGLDWTRLQGSGKGGRVRERDVRAAVGTTRAGRWVPHTSARRALAARMVAGVTVAAPVTLTTRVDATRLVEARALYQEGRAAPDDVVPSITDLLLVLTAGVLKRHPLLQAQWHEQGLFIPENIHFAVAVDCDSGLVAPVVRDAEKLSPSEMARRTQGIIAQARSGHLKADQLHGATFTLTNLGMFGVDAFTPIITLPQCAVLGVGRIVREPAVVDEEIVVRDRMTLSLTFDHRVVDGAPAARFLDDLRRAVEQASF